MKTFLWSALCCVLLGAVFVTPATAEKYDVIWLAVGPEELTAVLGPLLADALSGLHERVSRVRGRRG